MLFFTSHQSNTLTLWATDCETVILCVPGEVPWGPNTTSSGLNWVWEIARGLDSNGIEVVVYKLSQKKADGIELYLIWDFIGELSAHDCAGYILLPRVPNRRDVG